MKLHSCLAAAGLLMAALPPAIAADACAAYKWDVTPEVRLYTTQPGSVTVGATVADAPLIDAARLYALQLKPQESVQYAAPPSKKMLADGAYGGVLRLKVAAAGQYRVAIDSGFWLDVIHDGKPLDAADFNGVRDCDGPRKIVVYELPADVELTLQLGAAATAQAKLTVTAVATATP